MKRLLIAVMAFSLSVAPVALAQPGHGKEPPGLAKKAYGLPPGQAKKIWRKGEHLPVVYIAPRYYVEARAYHLAPPPPGYRWVVVEGDAYLVQTRSGVIANVIADVIVNSIR